MKNSFISGTKIYFRPASINDAKGNWYKWLNDRETTKYLTNQYWPNTKSQQIYFIKSALKTRERIVFSICLNKNNKQIGVCSLSSINWVHRYADIAVVIGERKYRNGHYSLEIYKLLLQVAFNFFNLKNIKSATANPIATKIHQLIGFKKAGSFKNLILVDDKKLSLDLFYLSKKMWKNISKN